MSSATTVFTARLVGSLALLVALGAAALAAPAAFAQGGGTAAITIHARVCPEGYQGTDLFETCHDNPPDPGLPFTLSNGVTAEGTTDANGNVTFDGLSAGTYTVTGGAPGEFAEERIFCALEQDLGDPIGADEVTGGVRFAVDEGQHVICDWFIIPQGQAGVTPTTPSAEDGTLTIYKATCPPGYEGTAYFEDCFENATADVQFVIGTTGTDNVAAATTGPQGFVTFELEPYLPGPGSTITFGEITVASQQDQNPVVVCTDATGASVEIVDTTTLQYQGSGPTFAVTIAPEADDQIRCDWYNVPPAVETPTPVPPTPTPDPDARPAAIREGDCDDEELGDVVVELNGLSEPEGETVGQEDATVAPASFTVVDLSLDQLLEEDHVITVGEEAADPTDDPVVCGEIGGVLNANGNLVIGLSEQDDSDYTGIAFLAPNPDDPDQTEISVFVAEGLAEDDLNLDLDEAEDGAVATEAA